MLNSRLAGRYAKSLMDIAVEQKTVEPIYQDMLGLQKIFNENRDLIALVQSPIIATDKKQSIFKAIFGGKINTITEQFINLIADKKREYFLPEIVKSFIAQYKEANHINTVSLTTAHELDEATKALILKNITEQLKGKTIDLHHKVDESLIGGFVLESNNNLFDASIARDLKDIQKQFLQNIYVPSLK
jgi:F-type H+-transporting ATPase subunit delta